MISRSAYLFCYINLLPMYRMRSYCPPLLQLVLLSVLVLSCKSSGKRFHLEGEIKNLNQGELYV